MSVSCPDCGSTARLVGGDVIYPHRPDLYDKRFWQCPQCPGTYVGCHPGTDRPLGHLASAELRAARKHAHAAFDPLWKSGRMTRVEAYGWLADALKLSRLECHIGMFSVSQCEAAIAAVEARKP